MALTIPFQVRTWLIVIATLTATAAGVGISEASNLQRDDWFVALALLAIVVVVERSSIAIQLSTGNLRVSVGAPIALAAAMHLGVGPAALIVLTGHFIDSALSRRDPIKSLTNICTFVCAATAGGLVYHQYADSSVSPLGSVENLTFAIVASLVFVFVSTLTMSLIVGPIIGLPLLTMWWSTIRLSAIEAVTLPTVGGLVAVVADENAAAVLLLAFPLVGPQFAYRALQRAQRSVRDTLESLTDVLEQRDEYTANHSVRVRNLADAIVEELSDIPYELTETILNAARVHDVGKVGTRDLTLFKPGPLTTAERLELQRHAEIGAEIVSRIAEYRLTASIIRHHHEHWDGSGYPDRLVGQEIPLGSRIIAVADAFDAMTTDRPYRLGMSPAAALTEIRRHSGTQFDPRVVGAFERVLEHRHRSTRTESTTMSADTSIPAM